MIIYMSVSNSVDNSSKLHILLATIVAGGRAQNVRSGHLLHVSFIACSTSPRLESLSKAVRACHLASHKLIETARMLTVSVIPVRRNNASLFETKSQRHISVLFSNRLFRLSFLLISTYASRWCLYMQRSDSFRLM